jgi:phospholipid/cholesterol/gamma-HCH transport system ATP-binding protein
MARRPDRIDCIAPDRTPQELMASADPETRQFTRGEPDGPVKFHYPAPEIAADFGVAGPAGN